MSEIKIETSVFGTLPTGEEVKRYILTNQTGFEVALISFGATVQSIKTRDRDGNYVNVVVNLNTLEEYLDPNLNKHFGTVGRTSNRIANAQFNLESVTYSLTKNDGENLVHGGTYGFDMKPWDSEVVENGVRFKLTSSDGEGGYPGKVTASVTFTLGVDHDTIYLEFRANTNKTTPIDLSNHALFNLNGFQTGLKAYNHEIKIYSDNYLPINPADYLETGEILPVDNTRFDFKDYVKLGERLKENIKWPNDDGYANYFILNQQTGKRHAISVKNPDNGIVLDVFTNQNGFVLYTGSFLDVVVPSTGYHYRQHDAICLLAANYPDGGLNKRHFPSSIVRPEGEYIQNTQWSFSVEK